MKKFVHNIMARSNGEPVRELNFLFRQCIRESLIRRSGSMRCTCKQATRISAPRWRRGWSSGGWRGKGPVGSETRANLTGYASQCITYHTLVRVHFGTTTCTAVSFGDIIIHNQVFELRPKLHEKIGSYILRHGDPQNTHNFWFCYTERLNCKVEQ